jgi:hypothetical protein
MFFGCICTLQPIHLAVSAAIQIQLKIDQEAAELTPRPCHPRHQGGKQMMYPAVSAVAFGYSQTSGVLRHDLPASFFMGTETGAEHAQAG